jgi:regulation of enolase protein 1 (concanavalin A-like superfamily)
MKIKNIVLMAAVATVALTGCNNKEEKVQTTDFVDDVKVALADSGRIDLAKLQWTREPAGFDVKNDTITVTTAPHTDLWQRTYYHFQNDNAPVLQMKTREKFFSFVVKTDFSQSHHRFDQCGIVMYLHSENWLKGSVEYENEDFQHLGSVATNNGYSDWATTAIPADVKTMWYRFSRREDDYCIECSTNGVDFSQMRICHMAAAAEEISFGIYACSPEESSFTAVFTDMKLTECMWKAHDGQQPDQQ